MPNRCEVYAAVTDDGVVRSAPVERGGQPEVTLRLVGEARFRRPTTTAGLLAVFDVTGVGAMAVTPAGWAWVQHPHGSGARAFGGDSGWTCVPTHFAGLSVPSAGIDVDPDFFAELASGDDDEDGYDDYGPYAHTGRATLVHRQYIAPELLPAEPGDRVEYTVRLVAGLRRDGAGVPDGAAFPAVPTRAVVSHDGKRWARLGVFRESAMCGAVFDAEDWWACACPAPKRSRPSPPPVAI